MTLQIRTGLGLIAVSLLLNFLLSFHNIWPTLWITTRWEVSAEIAGLLFLLAWHRRAGTPLSSKATAAYACIVFVMVIGRYLEVTAPALFGRAVNLYWDAQYLPAVAAMLAESTGAIAVAAITMAAFVLLALVYSLLYVAIGFAATQLATYRTRQLVQRISACVVALYFLGYYTPLPTLKWFSIPVSQTYLRQAAFVVEALSGPQALAALPDTSPISEIQLNNVENADVLISFIESYGAVAFDEPSISLPLEVFRQEFAAAVKLSNRQVVSAFIEAPTFGGGSWLSHVSLMTGLKITDPASYDALLTQTRQTLPKLYRDAGYRAVALMPGLRNEWPEGSFYGFDDIYGAVALNYAGPEFGWWRIPDQFSIAKLHDLELAKPDRAPAFVFYPTISTHMPFRPTPPYQSDWDRVTSEDPYSPAELGHSLTQASQLTNLRPAYTDALAYTYQYWTGYLSQHAEDNLLLVLVGDHQPPASVAGEGVRWDVPVHVISNDKTRIDQLIARGFQPGITPLPAPIAQMHELGPLLLRQQHR